MKDKLGDGCTFTPSLCRKSRFINESLHSVRSLNEDKYTQLSKNDYFNIENKKFLLQEQFYKQYDFKPKINDLSQKLAQPKSIDQLHYDQD